MTASSPLFTHVAIGVASLMGGFVLGRVVERSSRGQQLRDQLGLFARLIIAAVLIGLAVITVVDRDRRATCYETYFRGVSQSLADRSAATGAAAASVREFLTSIDRNGAVDLVARDRYLAALDQQEQSRRAAPLPTPPNC